MLDVSKTAPRSYIQTPFTFRPLLLTRFRCRSKCLKAMTNQMDTRWKTLCRVDACSLFVSLEDTLGVSSLTGIKFKGRGS